MNQHEKDEAITDSTDIFSHLWWNLYDKLVKEGFTEAQALELVKTFILSQGKGAT